MSRFRPIDRETDYLLPPSVQDGGFNREVQPPPTGWMTGVMANRMQIYDIGLDSRPRVRSQNYRMERQFIDLARYPNYEQRPWNFNGGWDYR